MHGVVNVGAPAAEFPVEAVVDSLISKLIAKRGWIIGSTALSGAAFAIIAFVMAPVYRSTTLVAPANIQRNGDVSTLASASLGGLASGLGLGPRDAETEQALAVLRSREFTENFIASENLMPKLSRKLWNPPTLAKAYKYFDTRIRSVTQDKKTGLVTIQIDWNDRTEAAGWANKLVRHLNEEMRSRAISKAEASTQFLNRELLGTTTVEGRDAISRLLEAELKRKMLATVTPDYSFQVVDHAMPADADDRLRPQKALMVAAGLLLGLGVSVVTVLGVGRRRGNARVS
jgi:uncharacterized protein involved in exopolysaccharide biosynthesis